MAKPTLSTVFTAQDMMSPQIKKMQDSVSRMSEKIQQVNSQASGSFFNLRNAAIVTLASMGISKLKSFAEEFASTGDEIAKTASRLGMTSVELQRLRYAMGQQGVSSETLTQSFEVLNKNLGLLQNNQGALYSKLRKSNPEMLKQISNTKNNSEAFTLLMDALDKTSDATEKAAISTIAFGGAGQMMILASKGGSKTLNELGDTAERFGLISNEDAAKAEGLNDSLDRMSKAIQGLISTGYVPLLQNLSPVIDKFAFFLSDNKEFIAMGIDKSIDLLSKAFDILKIGMDTGIIPVIIAMKLAFEAAKIAIVAQTAVTTAYTVIQSILDVGLIATTKLIIAQNAAWLASPIGIVIVSLAALASAFYLVYTNIEIVDKWISSLWNWFTELNIVLKVLIGYLTLTGIVALIAFAPITATVLGVMIAIYALVKAYQYLKSKISGEPIETEIKAPEIPNLPEQKPLSFESQQKPLSFEMPKIPEIKAPEMPKIPEQKPLSFEIPKIPEQKPLSFEMPKIPEQKPLSFEMPKIPEQKPLSFEMPKIPKNGIIKHEHDMNFNRNTVEFKNKSQLPAGMEVLQNRNLTSANSGMLSQTINRNNNSNVVVDFKNLPQFANVTQKGAAPNININRGMNIDPFILFGGGFK